MMKPTEVPGYKIVEDKIREINKEIVIDDVIYDFDRMIYKFKLSNKDRKCVVIFREAFLDDLNDYSGNKLSEYWKNMESALVSTLLTPIEKHGLISFTKETLKELILLDMLNLELLSMIKINQFSFMLGSMFGMIIRHGKIIKN